MKDAIEEIDEWKLESAKEFLEKGINLLSKHQNILKMTNINNGWEGVRNYVSDDRTENADEKRDTKRARRKALISKKVATNLVEIMWNLLFKKERFGKKKSFVFM